MLNTMFLTFSIYIVNSPLSNVGPGGLEPPTPRLSSVCSNQLSYGPKNFTSADYQYISRTAKLMEPIGFEPTTSCVQGRRSSN